MSDPQDFNWLMQMRFYYDPRQRDVLQQLSIHMANARFQYGFEYLGVQDKLVQTPLTDRSGNNWLLYQLTHMVTVAT